MAVGKRFPEFRKRLGPTWWLGNRHYTMYMLRELTSFFVAVFSIFYIWQLGLQAVDPAGYRAYLDLLHNPFMIVFSVIALGFTLYHSLTWFYLTGQVVPIRVGRRTTTPAQALVVNVALMLIISFAVVKVLLGV